MLPPSALVGVHLVPLADSTLVCLGMVVPLAAAAPAATASAVVAALGAVL